jgi:acyl-homoserine-lactone acylase
MDPERVARSVRQWTGAAAGEDVPEPEPPASNGWAIGPARSASGHAMLLANPHLPWGDLFTWYEAQLTVPGLDVYGATLVGFPMPGIAFNDHLGWTHTVNTFDGADLYELTEAEGGYRFDGATRAFDTEDQVIRARQADGTLRDVPLRIRRSVHGPVVAEKPGRMLALRVVGLDRPFGFEQIWRMLRAASLNDFQAALSGLQLPMFTVIYADRDGHIMHLFNGLVPVRSRGDWNYWQGIVPGDSSATLWTNVHGYAELPRLIDPESGWLQNANDPPWTTTIPLTLDPSRYPTYMAPMPSMAFRPQRSARMLVEDESITFDELVRYKHSTRMEAADHILEDVIVAARRFGGPNARKAADVLERWDRTAESGSRGAVLFEAFFNQFARRRWPAGTPYDVPWTERAPLSTPDGLSDPAGVAALLEATAGQVESTFGALDIAWGDVRRLRRDSVDLPGNGGPGSLGIFRVADFDGPPSEIQTAAGGDSYVAAIEFSNPVRAMTLIGYGNASQPGSPHRTDQMRLFARKELAPVIRDHATLVARAVLRESF